MTVKSSQVSLMFLYNIILYLTSSWEQAVGDARSMHNICTIYRKLESEHVAHWNDREIVSLKSQPSISTQTKQTNSKTKQLHGQKQENSPSALVLLLNFTT